MKLVIFSTTVMFLFSNAVATTSGTVDGGAAVGSAAATTVDDMTGATVSGGEKQKNHRGRRGLGKKAEGKDPGYDGYNCKLCPDDDY